jgi:hypothetical protein
VYIYIHIHIHIHIYSYTYIYIYIYIRGGGVYQKDGVGQAAEEFVKGRRSPR